MSIKTLNKLWARKLKYDNKQSNYENNLKLAGENITACYRAKNESLANKMKWNDEMKVHLF